jgi:hypothetical protein
VQAANKVKDHVMDKMPADPFLEIEESRLERSIEAIDWQKTERGITWGQYLNGVIDLLLVGPYAENEGMAVQIGHLQDLVPGLQTAERLGTLLYSHKREIAKAVSDTMLISRYLMDEQQNVKEDKNG